MKLIFRHRTEEENIYIGERVIDEVLAAMHWARKRLEYEDYKFVCESLRVVSKNQKRYRFENKKIVIRALKRANSLSALIFLKDVEE